MYYISHWDMMKILAGVVDRANTSDTTEVVNVTSNSCDIFFFIIFFFFFGII